MAKGACFLLLYILSVACYAQQKEEVFRVKKPATTAISKKEVLPNLDFLTGIDTLRNTIMVDAAKMIPFFDSIATLNLNVQMWGTRMVISGPDRVQSCKGILKLFKKKENGEPELVYFHAFRVENDPVEK